jgi:NifU-like protein involved in Fe-S cluster formation
MRAEASPGPGARARTVAACVDAPRHAGSLEGATRVGEASDGGRIVRIGLFAGGAARFRATSCAALIAYAEVACEAIEGGRRADAADPDALRTLLRGVHRDHLERAALVAAAVRAALTPEEP